MMLADCQWNFPTTIWFGNGRLRDLPLGCTERGIRRPLLVTDEGLAALPMVQQALDLLQEEGCEATLFAGVQGNPTGAQVVAGVSVYRESGCDGVVALGGGSALDAGKTIALVCGQNRPLWDFEDIGDNWQRANPDEIAPVIAVPTTAGTGSEVGRAAVILDERTHLKKILFHPAMLPGLVISDPLLTIGLPANITAWTGIDAFVHALEAYLAPGFHPLAEGIAVEAMRLVQQFLPRAVADGSDLEARGQMLAAASMGATAFQKGLGSIHALSHVEGGLYNTHHGLTNAIVLPYGVYLNAPAIGAKLGYLCRVLDLAGTGAEDFIRFLQVFCTRLDIPPTLAELEVDASRAGEIGALALQDPSAAGNARALSAGQYSALFKAAVSGDYTALDAVR